MKRSLSKLFLLLLGWLGLASCVTDPDPPEYGMPYADFLIDGTVVSAEAKEPIQGIELKFKDKTTFSDANAKWSFAVRGTPFPSTYFIIATDVDGDDNGGAFDPDTVWISPTKTKPGLDWYAGVFEQHNIVIELDRTESETE